MTEEETKATETSKDTETQEVRDDDNGEALPEAEAVIEAFGGIRPMASAMGIAVSTVQGWKVRNHIPPARWPDVEKAAKELNIDLSDLPAASGSPQKDKEQGDVGQDATPPSDAPSMSDRDRKKRTDAPKDPPSTGPEGGSGGGSGSGGLAFLLGLVAVVGLLTQPVWGPRVYPHVEGWIAKTAPGLMAEQTATPEQGAALSQASSSVSADEVKALHDSLTGRIDRLEAKLQTLADNPPTDAGTGSADLEALKGTVATVRGDLDALSAKVAEGGESPATRDAIDALKQKTATLETTVSSLENSVPKAARVTALENASALRDQAVSSMQARIEALSSKVEAVEAHSAGDIAREVGLVLSVGQAESALAGSGDLGAAAEAIQRFAGNDRQLSTAADHLVAVSGSGIATRTELLRRFQILLPAASRAERGGKDGSWIDKIIAELEHLVTIRKKGETADQSPVSRAEAAMNRDDFAGATEALAELSGRDADIDRWIAAAESRLAAEEALRRIRVAAIARLERSVKSGEGQATSNPSDGTDANAGSMAAPQSGPTPSSDGENADAATTSPAPSTNESTTSTGTTEPSPESGKATDSSPSTGSGEQQPSTTGN